MSTVSNWIDHLNKPAEDVAGSVYPGASSIVNCSVDWMDFHH